MRHTTRRAAIIASLAAIALSGCSRQDFATDDAEGFVASCVETSTRIGNALGMRPGGAAELVAMSVMAPEVPDVARRFDPGRLPVVVGTDVRRTEDASQACTRLLPRRASLQGMTAWTAVDGGLAHWVSALSIQDRGALTLKDEISDTVAGKQRASGRIAELISRFSPRGVSYTVTDRGGRPAPSFAMKTFNPLDQPIEGMFLAVDLKRPDGSVIAQGRLTFKPAIPLGPTVETTYMVDLAGVQGFESPMLADVRGNVSVGVRIEDVLSGGHRLLGDTIADPEDRNRLKALAVLRGGTADMRDYVRRLREREAAYR